MKIGMIVAIPREVDALFKSCGAPAGVDEAPGYTVWRYTLSGHDVFVTGSGAGELSAASSTQYLITRYGVEMLVNFGVVGGLTEEMALHRTVAVKKAVHYDYDVTAIDPVVIGQYPGYTDAFIPADEKLLALALEAAPELKAVICASADKFVAEPDAKRELNRLFGAEICEMEAAGILLTARRNGVPALLIKGVSDSVTGGAEEFGEMVREASRATVEILLKILEKL